MNKKIFILLPALLAIGLASCGEDTSTTSSSSSSSSNASTSKPVEPLKEYGSLDEPKTVREFLDFCDENVEKEDYAHTDGVFYVKAVARQYSYYAQGSFYRIDLSDKSDDDYQVPAFSVARESDVNVEEMYRDDEVVIKGVGEYYEGRYTIYPLQIKTHYVQPTLLSFKRAQCNVTFAAGNYSLDSSFDTSKTYENGTEISFKIKASDDYSIYSVKANGHLLTPGDTDTTTGFTTYTHKISGHTNIVIRSAKDITEQNIPAGEYSVTLEKSVLDLPLQNVDEDAKEETKMNFEVKEDTDEAIYKKLGVTFSAGAVNSYQYNEFGFPFNGYFTINLDSENATITSLDVEYYLDVDENAKVYNSIAEDAEAVTGTKGDDNKYTTGYKYNYPIASNYAHLKYDEDNSYYLMFYYIIVNITVAE